MWCARCIHRASFSLSKVTRGPIFCVKKERVRITWRNDVSECASTQNTKWKCGEKKHVYMTQSCVNDEFVQKCKKPAHIKKKNRQTNFAFRPLHWWSVRVDFQIFWLRRGRNQCGLRAIATQPKQWANESSKKKIIARKRNVVRPTEHVHKLIRTRFGCSFSCLLVRKIFVQISSRRRDAFFIYVKN